MAVNTYFWDAAGKTAPTTRRRWFGRRTAPTWRAGNVGDIYNADLIRHLYGLEPNNVEDSGPRILLVGSTVHRMLPGDIVAGVGSKGAPIPLAQDCAVEIRGVRGPLTAQRLQEAGHDLGSLQFMLDPGLLIGEIYPHLRSIAAEPGRRVFIPHYRERDGYRGVKDLVTLDVDDVPEEFARGVARAEIVYSSSLHGVIFAHALGRPAVLVAPMTPEPELKYRDYYASVGLAWQTPLALRDALRRAEPRLPDSVASLIETASFPTLSELIDAEVAADANAGRRR